MHIAHSHSVYFLGIFCACIFCIEACQQIAISIKPHDDMAPAILYIGSPSSQNPQKKHKSFQEEHSYAWLKHDVTFSLLVVGWMKKGQSFAIRCFWYPKKYNICDQLHTTSLSKLLPFVRDRSQNCYKSDR